MTKRQKKLKSEWRTDLTWAAGGVGLLSRFWVGGHLWQASTKEAEGSITGNKRMCTSLRVNGLNAGGLDDLGDHSGRKTLPMFGSFCIHFLGANTASFSVSFSALCR